MKSPPLSEALRYAISVIESYELDIRSLRLPVGYTITMGPEGNFVVSVPQSGFWLCPSLDQKWADEVGFCQGLIYKTAVETIKRIAAGELAVA